MNDETTRRNQKKDGRKDTSSQFTGGDEQMSNGKKRNKSLQNDLSHLFNTRVERHHQIHL